MKVLLINTYSFGGAAAACIRLHEGLLRSGVDSNLLFMNFSSNRVIENIQVYKPQPKRNSIVNRVLNKLDRLTEIGRARYDRKIKEQIKKLIPDIIEWFSFPDSGMDISTHPLFRGADIINIHWIADFIDFSFLKNNTKPIVWTLHDMNAFTGGCHYSGDCNKYLSGCTVCPQLLDCDDNTFAGRNFKIKIESMRFVNGLHIVAPSKWLEDLSKTSLLLEKFPHYHIPNGIDHDIFQPEEQTSARQKLNLPVGRKIFLFIADDLKTKRKRYNLLKTAFEKLASDDVVLCSVGRSGTGTIDNPNVIELGVVQTEKEMNLVYSAADLFIIPSLEDNLPNTVIEALLCGIPVAGFPIGGITDMITDGVNGYLASKVGIDELVLILRKYLNGKHIFNKEKIRNNAILKYGIAVQVNAYKKLYVKVLSQ
jgi:glycosyltransferase involved in cell wall biosynthesis